MPRSDVQVGVASGRRRRWISWAIAVTVVIALAAGGIGATYTPLFEAEQVLVRGAQQLNPRAVRRISGLVPGTNILHADLAAAAARLERDAWVESARVDRELPATLVIEIRERLPVARTTLDGEPAAVTADGTVIMGSSIPRLPQVFSSEGAPRPSFSGAAAALGAMRSDVRRQVSAVLILPGGSLLVQLRRGVLITYGPPTEVSQKAQAIESLLTWAEHERAVVVSIDVTVPQTPTVRLPGGRSRSL